jgi:FAD/FMN-containing dehydrogenase
MTAPCTQAPVVHITRNRSWKNWHESVDLPQVAQQVDVWNGEPERVTVGCYNATTKTLQDLVAQALAQGIPIRAAGGTWSFTPVAATTGMLINTRFLNYVFRLTAHHVQPAFAPRVANLAFVQCGTSIAELSGHFLAREPRKSLLTSGASNGQTIVGAMSTGTHGSALDVGGVQDTILGLHLITAPDRHVWLEPASAPVASQWFLDLIDAERISNDSWFNAALVNLGSFGIVHGVMLQASDMFYLVQYRRPYTDSPTLRAVLYGLQFGGDLPRPGVRPYFMQALFNPYHPERDPHLTVMYREPTRPEGCLSLPRQKNWRAGDGAAELVGRATDMASDLTPGLIKALLPQLYPRLDGVCGTWADTFWDTTTRGRTAATAIGAPLARAEEVLDLLFRLAPQHHPPALFALRYSKATRATLGFTRHAPHTCIVEIDGPLSDHMREFQRAVWQELADSGIPHTYHWGKMFPLDPAHARSMYGAAIDSWTAARRNLLRSPELLRAFSNPMLENLELDQ